jgi:nitrile hydratase
MSASFAAGDRVRVRSGAPAGHYRTPAYLQGKRGVIVRPLGRFRDPEKLAYHKPGLPLQPLYQVCFDYAEVWGGSSGSHDTITADIYQHWLLPEAQP